MTTPESISINLAERFEHLPRAPVVEAVVDIRCRPSKPLEEDSLRSTLKDRLKGYSYHDSQREFEGEMKIEPGKPVSQTVWDRGWKGLRFKSSDGRHIVQFNKTGFVFSRLHPYQNWAQLTDEALGLWEHFCQIAQPVDIQRIGLRFINRIPLPEGSLKLSDFISPAPAPPRELPLPSYGFMYQDTLVVPGHPYAINVVRTIQPRTAENPQVAIILDIDVFTSQSFPLDSARLLKHLKEMQWLKNKVFFGSVEEKALELCRS